MKKVIPILLILLILLNSIGYIFLYVERLTNNKLEIRAILNSHQNLSRLLKLKFTKKEFTHELNWKEEKEFEYNGMMYDIEKIEFIDDDVNVYCIRDEVEEQLISSYDKVCGDTSDKDKIAPNHQTSLFNLQLLAIQNDRLSFEIMTAAIPFSDIYINYYHSFHQKSLTPPPKVI